MNILLEDLQKVLFYDEENRPIEELKKSLLSIQKWLDDNYDKELGEYIIFDDDLEGFMQEIKEALVESVVMGGYSDDVYLICRRLYIDIFECDTLKDSLVVLYESVTLIASDYVSYINNVKDNNIICSLDKLEYHLDNNSAYLDIINALEDIYNCLPEDDNAIKDFIEMFKNKDKQEKSKMRDYDYSLSIIVANKLSDIAFEHTIDDYTPETELIIIKGDNTLSSYIGNTFENFLIYTDPTTTVDYYEKLGEVIEGLIDSVGNMDLGYIKGELCRSLIEEEILGIWQRFKDFGYVESIETLPIKVFSFSDSHLSNSSYYDKAINAIVSSKDANKYTLYLDLAISIANSLIITDDMIRHDHSFFELFYIINNNNMEQMRNLLEQPKNVYSQHLALAMLHNTPYIEPGKYHKEVLDLLYEHFKSKR